MDFTLHAVRRQQLERSRRPKYRLVTVADDGSLITSTWDHGNALGAARAALQLSAETGGPALVLAPNGTPLFSVRPRGAAIAYHAVRLGKDMA